MTKAELASLVEVTPAYISNMEHDRNDPPDYTLCSKLIKSLRLDDSEKRKFLKLAFEGRLKDDINFLQEIDSISVKSDKETEAISKEVLAAIEDPVAVKALLITYRGSDEVKRTIRHLLETVPNMASDKRKAILALCS